MFSAGVHSKILNIYVRCPLDIFLFFVLTAFHMFVTTVKTYPRYVLERLI
jgi:hypothetical protein